MTHYMELLFPTERVAVAHLYSREAFQLGNDSDAHLPSFLGDKREGSLAREHAIVKADTVVTGGELERYNASAWSESPEKCCESCARNPLCIAWQYIPAAGGGAVSVQYSRTNYCYLKGSGGNASYLLPGAEFGSFEAPQKVEAQHSPATKPPTARQQVPRAIILHGTTCGYQNQTVRRRDINTILIGRFMVERDRLVGGISLDEYSVLTCSTMVDEIWVPTPWHKGVFGTLLKLFGYERPPPIEVIPEAVNTDVFSPLVYANRPDLPISQPCMELLDRPFVFLSIFKWEHRKGWDILLNSYWNAFSVTDNVVLKLRTYVPRTERGTRDINYRLEAYAQHKFNKSKSEVARVEWVSVADEAIARGNATGPYEDNVNQRVGGAAGDFSRMDVRDLYASADAFVLPTRGEGWGLPIAEAMAMALPVLITNFSGPTAYANTDNAYLIPVVSEDARDSSGFAVPDGDALVSLMRQLVVDSSCAGTSTSKSTERLDTPEHGDNDDTECVQTPAASSQQDALPTEAELCTTVKNGGSDGCPAQPRTCYAVSQARQKGLMARETMQTTFSPAKVVEKIAHRLRVLAEYRGWRL